MEFTPAHRAAAAAAHVAGRVLVLDAGPKAPEPIARIEGIEPTDAEKLHAHNLAAEHKAWHEANKEPITVSMRPIDATEAAARDPERYLIVPRADREPVTLEERMNRVEQVLELGQWSKDADVNESGDPDVEDRHRAEDAAARAPLVDPAVGRPAVGWPPAGNLVQNTSESDADYKLRNDANLARQREGA